MSSENAKDRELLSYQALADENRALKDEVRKLRASLEEAEELRRAVSEGDLDALVMPGPEGELVFTLDSADRAYRVLVETMNEGTATLAFDGTILYCNRRFAELLKMPLQTILGMPIHQFIAPESTAFFRALLKQKMSSGEIKLLAGGKTCVPAYISVSSLEAEGSPNAWCLVVTDLTEQKKNEEILASERLTHSIIEQAAEAVIVCDTSGRVTLFSNATSKLCGCDPTFQRFEDIINLRFSEEAEEGKSILPVSSALNGSTILGMEATFEREDCQRFHLLLNSGPLKNADGEIIGCVVTLSDISERKRMDIALKRNEQHLNDILNSIQDSFFELDREWRFTYINQCAARNGGFEPEELIGECIWEKFPYMANSKFEEMYRQVMETRLPAFFDIQSLILNRWYGVSVYPSASGISAFWRDITDRKRSEVILEAINSINRIIHSTLDFNEIMQTAVSEAVKAFGCETAAVSLREGQHWIVRYAYGFPEDIIGSEMNDDEEPHAVLAIKTKKPVVINDAFNDERVNRNHMKKWGVRSVLATPLVTGDRAVGVLFFNYLKSCVEFDELEIGFATQLASSISLALENSILFENLGKELAERKQAEEALRKASETLEEKVKERTSELEEAYNSLLENEIRLSEAQRIAHLGNWDWDLRTDNLYWSEEIYRIFGLDPLEFGRTYDAFLNYVDPDDLNHVNNAVQKALNGELLNIEYGIILPDGGKRIVHVQGEVVFDEKLTPVRMRGTIRDITERKMAEEALEKIDKTRIKEIHHRIKNNLQVICSLLSLEAEKFSDEKMLTALRESRNRVVSMALIHEELYRGDKNDALDFASYLRKLSAELFGLYKLGNDNVSLKMDLERVYLDMDTAVPLGIIVNELVSNSLKHAFPAGSKGEINIQLCKTENSTGDYDISGHPHGLAEENGFYYVLTVTDNGKGIPEEIELQNAESLGLQLVNILVEQIDGHIELKRDHGTKFTILFNNIGK